MGIPAYKQATRDELLDKLAFCFGRAAVDTFFADPDQFGADHANRAIVPQTPRGAALSCSDPRPFTSSGCPTQATQSAVAESA